MKLRQQWHRDLRIALIIQFHKQVDRQQHECIHKLNIPCQPRNRRIAKERVNEKQHQGIVKYDARYLPCDEVCVGMERTTGAEIEDVGALEEEHES